MDQANSCVDAYKLEILRLNAKLRQHLITQQEILGAFYDFIESKLFDPANEKHLGLQATVAALDLSLQSAMQDQGNDIDELRDTLKKITEDLLASNKRIDELEARLSEQEYLRLLGDGIFELRTYVAVAMGFDSWASLATRLMLEKHYAVKPTRAQMAPILQQMGLDLAIWDSMTAVASQRNDRCHPGSSATSSHLLHCQ